MPVTRSIKLGNRYSGKFKGKMNKRTVAVLKIPNLVRASPSALFFNNSTYKSLSELENSNVLLPVVQAMVRNAVEEQVQKAKDLNLPISYARTNGEIVVRYGHGKAKVIGNIKRSSLLSEKLTNGTVLHAKKR